MAQKNILKEIVAKKNERLLLEKAEVPFEVLKEKVSALAPASSNFIKSINKQGKISLIAEIKKASPSRGVIREDFNLLEIARAYKEADAQALSVLTEEDYFQGHISFIEQIKQEVNLPILRKDFIIEEYQVYQSKLAQADAILLIANLLSKDALSELIEIAGNLGLDCLVEVHNEKELKKVLSLKKVNLIGINNRDLTTLEVDLKTTERLYPLIPKEKIVVVESGIKRYQDIMFFKILGIKAALIGEAFMDAPDIKEKVEEVMR